MSFALAPKNLTYCKITGGLIVIAAQVMIPSIVEEEKEPQWAVPLFTSNHKRSALFY